MKATPLLLCLACSALAAPPTKKQPEPAEPLPALEKNTIAIDGHPESVAADAEGNIYFTCIGSRLTPTEKDKDGYLGVIPHGSTEPKKITDVDTLDAPKGLLYQDGFLYCTDVDMVFKINAKTGAIEGYVDLSPSRMKFLNDLAFINGRLMVSSTDTNQIFYVDTNTSSYGELVPNSPSTSRTAWPGTRKERSFTSANTQRMKRANPADACSPSTPFPGKSRNFPRNGDSTMGWCTVTTPFTTATGPRIKNRKLSAGWI